jgi:hypothetical protein
MVNLPPVDRPAVRDHKRQFAWQILVPFLMMAGLIIAGVVLVITSGAPRTGVWVDVSLIWLLAPALFFAMMFLIIMITVIYGMARLLQVLPHYTGKAQGIFVLLSAGTRKIADGTVKPFILFQQAGAVIKSIFRL